MTRRKSTDGETVPATTLPDSDDPIWKLGHAAVLLWEAITRLGGTMRVNEESDGSFSYEVAAPAEERQAAELAVWTFESSRASGAQ